jgi:hypothetical protein
VRVVVVLAALLTGVFVAGLSSGADSGSPVNGFGATVKEWDATHVEDRRGNLVRGCCFDPMPVPGLVYGDHYYAVQPIDGIELSYEMHLKPVPATQAKVTAMHELPRDARVVSFTVHGNSCAILIASSAMLAKTLGADGKFVRDITATNKILGARVKPSVLRRQLGEVVIEFSSGAAGNTYDATAVNDLLLSSLAVAGSTAQNC